MTEPAPELPPDFVARLAAIGSALGVDLADRLAIERRVVFRVRPESAAATFGELRALGIETQPVPGLPDAAQVAPAARERLTRSAAAEDGRLYLQGASSQRCAIAVGAQPGERVLDLAAAPGGKTLLLAAAMRDQGELVAVEAVRDRYFRLRDVVDRAGLHSVRALCMDGRRLPHSWDASFDRVLLDAPCSAEARFVPGADETFRRWSLKKVRDMARKQWGLLGAAIRCLRPGGTLLYATCSFAPEENEATLAAHLGRADSLVELEDVQLGEGVDARPALCAWQRKRWPDEVRLARRILPDALHEGFFVARLRRTADRPSNATARRRGQGSTSRSSPHSASG